MIRKYRDEEKIQNTQIQKANTHKEDKYKRKIHARKTEGGLSHYLVDPQPRALFVHISPYSLRPIYSDHLPVHKNLDLLKQKKPEEELFFETLSGIPFPNISTQ